MCDIPGVPIGAFLITGPVLSLGIARWFAGLLLTLSFPQGRGLMITSLIKMRSEQWHTGNGPIKQMKGLRSRCACVV